MFDFTRATMHQALVGMTFLAMLASPAAAQRFGSAFGVTGGWSFPSDATPGFATSTTLESGWTAGVQTEKWWGSGRVATRLGAGYAERWAEEGGVRYQLLTADAGLALRILPPTRERAVAPFVAVGAGAVFYGGMHGSGPLGGGHFGSDPVQRAIVVGSVGADLFTGSTVGLRIEALDQVVLPSIGYSPYESGLARSHTPEIRAAVQVRMGRDPGPAVVASAQPAPAPVTVKGGAAEEAELDRLLDRLDMLDRQIVRLLDRLDSIEESAATVAAAPAAGLAPLGVPLAAEATPTYDGPLYTVQIGAFIEPATAARWADRLAARSLPVWISDHEIRGQEVKRVRVGAMPSRADADRLARQLRSDYGWEVWVDRVQDAEALPGDAVPATRRFLAAR